MASWTITITEEGNDTEVTSEITTSSSDLDKSNVNTFEGGDSNIPDAVDTYLQNSGIDAEVVQVLYLESVAPGQGAGTFYITASESNMLSEDPDGDSNGVVVVYNQSNQIVESGRPTKGKVKKGNSA